MTWKYSYNQRHLDYAGKPYLDPFTKAERNSKGGHEGEVKCGKANIAAPNNKSWDHFLTTINPLQTKEFWSHTKIFFVTRHGKADHNAMSDKLGKDLYWALAATDLDDLDPDLECPTGRKQAEELGRWMRELNIQFKISRYSSSLRRCVKTGIHVVKNIDDPKATLDHPIHVRDKLREWTGAGHHHTSDMRLTKSQIYDYAKELGGRVELGHIEELDPAVDQKNRFKREEAYVDVRSRIRDTLDEIFSEDSAPGIHLFLHNRCFRSFLRVIGHTEKQEFDLENCGTIVFLITQSADTETEQAKTKRHAQEKAQELGEIRKQLEERLMRAQQEAGAMATDEAKRNLNLLKKTEQKDRFVSWLNPKTAKKL